MDLQNYCLQLSALCDMMEKTVKERKRMKHWIRVLLAVVLAASMAVGALAAAQPHDHELTYVGAKDACIARQGNAEHYYCAACDKYFSDAEGTKELQKETVFFDLHIASPFGNFQQIYCTINHF